MESIYKRRSIRKYIEKDVEDEKIYEVLKAGMNAPSARNTKPWEFIVIKDRMILNHIVERNPHASMLKEAPVAIIVCGREKSEFWYQDLSACTQNILIRATELGLGSCWIGVNPIEKKENDLKEILDIPSDVRAFSMVSLGYSNEDKNENSNFTTDIIHRDRW